MNASIEVTGKVVALEGERALVEVDPQGCGRCHEPGGCGGQNITQMSVGRRRYPVLNTAQVGVGDRVSLHIESRLVRRVAFMAYVLPLLMCLAGAFVGQSLMGDLAAFGGAVVGILLGWLALKFQRSPLGISTPHPQLGEQIITLHKQVSGEHCQR